MQAYDPTTTFVHLDAGPGVTVLPVTDRFWATIDDRTELGSGRLVTGAVVDSDWTSWEQHPDGDELIVVTEGTVRIHTDVDGAIEQHVVAAPNYVVMPAGTWHTVDAVERARLLIITWGSGTTHRAR